MLRSPAANQIRQHFPDHARKLKTVPGEPGRYRHLPELGMHRQNKMFIGRQRVLGLLKAGKLDAALAELERAKASQPGAADLPVEVVEKLERAGRKKEAEQLYREAQTALAGILKDYPRSSWACNSSAWLSACA